MNALRQRVMTTGPGPRAAQLSHFFVFEQQEPPLEAEQPCGSRIGTMRCYWEKRSMDACLPRKRGKIWKFDLVYLALANTTKAWYQTRTKTNQNDTKDPAPFQRNLAEKEVIITRARGLRRKKNMKK